MNQNPQPNKKPTAPPQPQWNPYYRRNPDGTPGGHDRTLQENAARADAEARQVRERQTAAREGARSVQQMPTREGLGNPVRSAAPADRARPAAPRQPQPSQKKPPEKQSAANAPGAPRYRQNGNGTHSRVYSRNTSRAAARRNRRLLTFAAALLLVVALIIGIVAIVRGISPKVIYTYDYNGQFEVEIKGEEAMPEEHPYLNMNYLAAIYSMAVSGSYDDMKFSTAAGEYVSFVPGSRVTMVNGNRHVMSEPAILRGQEMWIPSDFVESMFEGIRVAWDHEEYTVTVTPETVSAADSTVAPLTFKLRPLSGSQVGAENWEEGYQYLTDMSAYRDAIEPQNRDAFLILVNKENPLTSTYTPADLTDVTNMKEGYTNTQKLCATAERALQALYQDMTAAGYSGVGVTSGYRSYQVQELLFEKYVLEEIDKGGLGRTEAEKKANRYSARAGQSEHQAGLAVDMYDTAAATVEFADSPAFTWLKENAHQYGFILRYPENKTDITGYDFEPWHFRYVGRYHATQIHEQGLCLEEYLAKLG
jgi:D-alanyl-D-alanine carboxypeptidase